MPPARAQYADPGGGGAIPPAGAVPGTSVNRPRFSVDATVQLGASGSPEVRLDYRLNRGELLFERAPGGYKAEYEVRVIFYLAKGRRQVTGDAVTRSLKAATYATTRTRNEDIVDHLEFAVAAGKYVVQVAITDLRAERISLTELEIEVPKRPVGTVWFTDLSLGTAGPDSGDSAERTRLVPIPSRRFGEEISSFAAYGEIVDGRTAPAPDSTFRLRYRVLDEAGQSVARGDSVLVRRGQRTAFLLRPALAGLSPGAYRFVVELDPVPGAGRESGKAQTAQREKRFEIEQSKAAVGPDIKESLEVLRYIATPAEQAEIGRLRDDAARQEFWEEFWLKRDPSPETPENEAREDFYRRVQYANQHFGVAGAGWRSDMGRVYIIHGRPDEIVRNPFNFDRPPEEIWYYYRDRRTFVFVDKDGFGRYELVRTGTP